MNFTIRNIDLKSKILHSLELLLEEFSETSKVWVYQSEKNFEDLSQEIDLHLQEFTSNWTSHQKPMKSFAKSILNHFIIIVVDETEYTISGCGIDKSVGEIKALESKYNLNFFDRSKLAYLLNEQVAFDNLNNLTITKNNWVFNNLVNIKTDLLNNWIITSENCWVNNFLT